MKANASRFSACSTEEGDPRRDGGFTLFYLGITSAAFIGPLITGLLAAHLGFHYRFGAAAIGMALGLAQYVVFRRNLGEHGRTVPYPLSPKAFWRTAAAAALVVAVVVVAFLAGFIKLANLSQVTTGIIIVASISYFAVMLKSPKVDALERTRVRAFIPLVHRQRGVLVAVRADLHRAGGLLRRADELVDLRLDRTVELDRLHRAGVDHPALHRCSP